MLYKLGTFGVCFAYFSYIKLFCWSYILLKNTCAMILAAGTGTRMCTKKPKVLLDVLFKPMLKWVIDAVNASKIGDICIVCGYEFSQVKEYLKANKVKARVVHQTERKGTAHAVYVAREYLEENIGKDIIILMGDVPFIDEETIKSSFELHKAKKSDATVISANVTNPFGYGRIVRDVGTKKIVAIIEQKDATEEVREIKEVNSAIYWFKVKSLLEVLPKITNYNNQNEFYLPDAVKLLLSDAKRVETYIAKDENIILGVNTKLQLNRLNEIAINKRLTELMQNGVEIPLKDGIIIGNEVSFGEDVKVLPGSVIFGKTNIGSGCTIGPNVLIENCTVKPGANLSFRAYRYETVG